MRPRGMFREAYRDVKTQLDLIKKAEDSHGVPECGDQVAGV